MATCPKCGYEWETRARGEMITCPSCHRKFHRPAHEIRRLPTQDSAIQMRGFWPCDVCGERHAVMTLCLVDRRTALVCDDCLGAGGK